MIPNSTLRHAYLTAIADALDAGGAAGQLEVYSAPQPANGAALTTQTLLGTAPLAYPAATVSGTTFTLNELGLLAVVADGTMAWGRYKSSTGAFVADCTVGDLESTADIKVSRTTVYTGGYVALTPTPIPYP